MNNRYIFAILAVVLILGIIFYASTQDDSQVASNSNNVNTEMSEDDALTNTNSVPANTNTTNTANINSQPAVDEPTVPQNVDIAVFEIVYNGETFAPSQLTIKNGDVVIFKNESDKSFWPASGPHPQHTNYPEFDPKKAIPAGQDWQFKFTKSGSWPFHDHLNSSVFGKITVQ
jgi:plastocyanin